MNSSQLMASVPIVSLRGLTKRFAGVVALDGAHLTIESGEIHGLLGENGSGKSTLIKILAGYYIPDSGELEMRGRRIALPLPAGRSRQLGMGFVHQDLALIQSLSALENLRIGEFAATSSWRLSWRTERRRAEETLARYGVQIDPRLIVSDLRPAERALLAIVRAVEAIRQHTARGGGRGVLVLDEPTVFLPVEEKERLFQLIRDVARDHASILFVSHDLDEVREITDRVTVLRDGRVQGTVPTEDTSVSRLIEMIVGRAVATRSVDHGRETQTGDQSIRIRGLTGRGLTDVSLDISSGEVVGVTGLPGTGFDDIPYLLYGAVPAERGQLIMRGRQHDLTRMTPVKALRLGLALLPKDRLRDGSVPTLPVEDNIMLPVLPRFRRAFRLHRRRVTAAAAGLLRRFDVRPPDPRLVYQSLSGGNQQKVLFGKWLQLDLNLWLLHEPTQGVDVGARQHIFRSIRDSAASDVAIVCASSDHDQLADICDRVIVFGADGGATELQGALLTKQHIGAACFELAASPHKRGNLEAGGSK